MNTIVISKEKTITRVCATILAVVCAIVLPQIFHLAGGLAGSEFLPMHIPVLIVGLIAGPTVGIVAGAVSPLISFFISGMPAIALLPFMMIELAAYGFMSGKLASLNMPVISKVLLTQVFGRVLRIAAMLVCINFFGNTVANNSGVFKGIAIGVPGVILQLLLIPIIMKVISKYNSEHI